METETNGIIEPIGWKKANDILYLEGQGKMKVRGHKKEWMQIAKDAKSIIIGEGITSFDFKILKSTSVLEEIYIPASFIQAIDLYRISPKNLRLISIDEKNKYFSSEDGVLFNKEKTKLYFCSKEKKGAYWIPDTVTTISCFAFKCCSGLKKIHIPESVREIESFAFSDCDNLEEIRIPEFVTRIEEFTFSSCTRLERIYIPESVTNINDWAFSDCKSLEEMHIPDSVKWIGECTFMGCKKLKQIYVSKNIELIGKNSFSLCDNLEEVTILNPNPIPFSVYNSLGINRDTCILYVPAESVEVYKNDDFWKNFKNILPIGIVSNEQTLTEQYLDFMKSEEYNFIEEWEKMSIKVLEGVIKNVNWWLALENPDRYEEMQQLCNLLFQTRKNILDAHFIYDQENIDKMITLNKRFEDCCILLKEEVKETFTRLNMRKHNNEMFFNFYLHGGIHVHNSHIEYDLACGPMSPKHKGGYLTFRVENEGNINRINQYLIFDTEANYADKIGIRVNEHISYAFYHYYNNSYLSLSDMLNIDYIRGVHHVIITGDKKHENKEI